MLKQWLFPFIKNIFRMKVRPVRGKSTGQQRKVFILFTNDMVMGLNYLLKSRHLANIPSDNKYVFARKRSLGPIDGCTAMREITEMCPGLTNSKVIRIRGLRKYLATTLQVFIIHLKRHIHRVSQKKVSSEHCH